MSTDIFETLAPTGDEIEIDVTKNYKEELVGEGKKYSDDEAFARAHVFQENHIRKLERENRALRETSAAQQKLEDLVTKLATVKSPISEPVQTERERDVDVQTPEKLEETLNSMLTRRDAEARQSRNANFVIQELKKSYGENYVVHLGSRIKNFGMSTDAFNALAAQSPEAALELAGVKPQSQHSQVSPPQSSVTTQVQPAKKGEKTRSYYRDLMKKDRALFLTPKIQNEMHEQAMRLGESFHDV